MGQTMSWREEIKAFFREARTNLMTPVDPLNHGLFRVCFGIVLLAYVYFYRSPEVMRFFYLSGDYHFSFGLFHALSLPEPTIELVMALRQVMLIAAVFIAAGFLFRIATAVWLMSFGYFFLLEKAVYAHQDYLILLFLLVFLVTGPGSFLSVDHKLFGKRRTLVQPYWMLFLFQIQVSLVYFFSVLSKMNAEWLSGRITSTLFAGASDGFIFASASLTLIVELCLAFMLIAPAFRMIGLILLVALNIAIKYYLDQTIMPILMISTAMLFINPVWIRNYLNSLRPKSRRFTPEIPPRDPAAKVSLPIWIFICTYLIVQLAVPLRHYLIPGSVQWNMRGDRFSWRFFAQQNVGHVDFFVTDIITGNTVEVPRLTGINAGSYLMMTYRPDMILQYADYLRERYARQGIYAPLVTVNSFVASNGRYFGLFMNPEYNIAHHDVGVNYPFLINPAGRNQPSTRILPHNVGKFFSAPYQLAVIDEGELLPGDHPLVTKFDDMIDALVDEEVISPYQVSNLVVEMKQVLNADYGRTYTTQDILSQLLDKYGHLGTIPELEEVIPDFIRPSS